MTSGSDFKVEKSKTFKSSSFAGRTRNITRKNSERQNGGFFGHLFLRETKLKKIEKVNFSLSHLFSRHLLPAAGKRHSLEVPASYLLYRILFNASARPRS
jgi:hypothetical protein